MKHVKTRSISAMLAMSSILIAAIIMVATPPAMAAPPRFQQLQLNVNDILQIHSDQRSIQQVFSSSSNITTLNVTHVGSFPTSDLSVVSPAPGSYLLQVLFNYSQSYQATSSIRNATALVQNGTVYYSSGGAFELDINATVMARTNGTSSPVIPVPPWESFLGWIVTFGQAFPLWVKLVYLVLGVQFFAVGGLWIKREEAKKAGTPQHLDAGNVLYLLTDVACKFLSVTFAAIIAVMFGELLILFVLKFMFLISLSLLSLWDLFVVGFALGAVILAYMVRFALGRGFDLKPMEDE